MPLSEDHLKVFSKLYSMSGGKASIPVKIWDLHLNLPEISLDLIMDVIKHFVQKGFFKGGGDSIAITPEGIDFYGREVVLATKKPPIYSIFISRIEEHKGIAEKLKDLLETAFPKKVNVFVANSIPFSEDWLKEILEGLKNCNLMIILCTPNSVETRWINFEAGAAAILDKNIGPICFGGQPVSDLPSPLNHLRPQGIDCSDTEGFQEKFQKFIENIAGKIDSTAPNIDIVKTEFYQMVTTYSKSSLHGEFEDPKKSAIDKLVNYYNRVSIDWNVYRPYAPFNKGTLDRLEQANGDLWSIYNSLNDNETKKIKPKLYNALNTLRYVIDSGRQGSSFFSGFLKESKRRKEYDEFFSLLKDSINELKNPNSSHFDRANQ